MKSGKHRYFKYRDGNYEAYRNKDGVTVFDRNSGAYFFVEKGKGLPLWEWVPLKVKNQYIPPMLLSSTVVVTIMYVFGVVVHHNGILIAEYRYVPIVFFFLLVYGLFQAVLHEAAHIFALSTFGYSADKIGFKFDYGFVPSFFVRVNKVLLLPPGQRMTVHLAGVFINSVVNLLLLFLAQQLNWGNVANAVFCLYTFGICVNFFPFFNSDGYKALICLLGIKEVMNEESISLKVVRWLSFLFVAAYFLYTFYAIARFVRE